VSVDTKKSDISPVRDRGECYWLGYKVLVDIFISACTTNLRASGTQILQLFYMTALDNAAGRTTILGDYEYDSGSRS
jgi:hypothetical protein